MFSSCEVHWSFTIFLWSHNIQGKSSHHLYVPNIAPLCLEFVSRLEFILPFSQPRSSDSLHACEYHATKKMIWCGEHTNEMQYL